MTALSHDVVICTRNRVSELRDCLTSIACQTVRPGVVHLIDASDGREVDGVGRLIDEVALNTELILDHVRAQPNLGAQRNLGVQRSSADVVHFVDDDTVLEPDYLDVIVSTFEADTAAIGDPLAVLGVGGQPTNLPRRNVGLCRKLLSRWLPAPGSVLASGRGVLPAGLTDRTDVDWLSGCAMSFRRTAIAAEPFDEGLSGYALGEDLEVCYRIRQHGRLVLVPAARLEHRESPKNRWTRRRWAEVDVVNRRRRVASGTGRYSVRAFWSDGALQLLLWSARACRPGATEARAMASGILAGLWSARSVTDASPAPRSWPGGD